MSRKTILLFLLAFVGLSLPMGCAPRAERVSFEPADPKVEIVEEYWPDGALRLRKEVRRSAKGIPVNHGKYTRWHLNGKKEYEAVFVLGKKNGMATLWHENGQKWTEEHYLDGQKHGPRYLWDEAGRKLKEENFFHGKPHGTWTLWKKDGHIKWQQSFEHGKPIP
ncbi:MAG: hypothetical protein KJ749_15340 [Planctomycetes bacterium]|nr:hypothetical protein [Planctomycetota bacterium]